MSLARIVLAFARRRFTWLDRNDRRRHKRLFGPLGWTHGHLRATRIIPSSRRVGRRHRRLARRVHQIRAQPDSARQHQHTKAHHQRPLTLRLIRRRQRRNHRIGAPRVGRFRRHSANPLGVDRVLGQLTRTTTLRWLKFLFQARRSIQRRRRSPGQPRHRRIGVAQPSRRRRHARIGGPQSRPHLLRPRRPHRRRLGRRSQRRRLASKQARIRPRQRRIDGWIGSRQRRHHRHLRRALTHPRRDQPRIGSRQVRRKARQRSARHHARQRRRVKLQRTTELRHRRESIVWIGRNRAQQHGLERRRRIEAVNQPRPIHHHLRRQLFAVQRVQRTHAQRIHIRPRITEVTARLLLGRNVHRTVDAALLSKRCVRRPHHRKVRQPRMSRRVKQDVGRLDVSVEHLAVVRIAQRRPESLKRPHQLHSRQLAALNPLTEVSTRL